MEPSWSVPIPQAMQQHGGLTRSKSAPQPAAPASQTVSAPMVAPVPAHTREPESRS